MSYKGKSPYQYDKNSKSWREGAFKNWPRHNPDSFESRRLLVIDRENLERTRRGE